MSKEKYKCMNNKCGFEFEAKTGPVTCNLCKSIYVKWVSFETDWIFNESNNEWEKNEKIN